MKPRIFTASTRTQNFKTANIFLNGKSVQTCFSPRHSSTVSLALNTTTSFFISQFHVVHDELFNTLVNHGLEQLDELWDELYSIGREND